MPATDAPTVNGPAAKAMALEMLRQIRSGTVDRRLLADEYSAFLTPARLTTMSQSLVAAGEVSQADAANISERGGLEVSTLRVMVGTTPIRTLLYRSPDGKIEEFLFNRR